MQSAISEIKVRKPILLRLPFFIMYPVAIFNELFSFIIRQPALLSISKVREMSHSWVCDNNRIKKLGFCAKTPLEEGLCKTYIWYIENGWLK